MTPTKEDGSIQRITASMTSPRATMTSSRDDESREKNLVDSKKERVFEIDSGLSAKAQRRTEEQRDRKGRAEVM